MIELPNDIESLQELNQRLLEKNAQRRAEIAELRRRLGPDRSHSHKPPSRDGYQKKTVKPDLPKERKRPHGGQKRHRGNTLKRVEPTEHEHLQVPSQCQCCGHQFRAAEVNLIQSRQGFELVAPKLEVTEHRLGQVKCGGLFAGNTQPR
ncbi:hypothetical protein THII_2121 [Thioploca ingrica]|uniref:Uncharacterized protein n=1 Tax=Thioploca ingrica TaxID=40754 RepID=A0A090AEK1_9GAMM|nr:hypothetical protein THII_2121 [Thioploca ingrica]